MADEFIVFSRLGAFLLGAHSGLAEPKVRSVVRHVFSIRDLEVVFNNMMAAMLTS